METKVCCGGDIFGYAKVSAIVELCLSVIMNIVLLLGLNIAIKFADTGILLPGIFNFILISTNTILVSLELNSFCGKSVKKWNLLMRIIWTVVVGLIMDSSLTALFLYGIFKSFLLSKMLKSQSELPHHFPLTEL
jgi:hypothetical protein